MTSPHPEDVEGNLLYQVRLDAERYQFLRAEAYEAVIPNGNTLCGKRTAWITKLHPGPSFDAAIDAAIAKAGSAA